jgi:DNA-binding transcriptional MerR regulator
MQNAPPNVELPDKLYFKIGEVSQLSGVPPYVLRFWETEFRRINPKRTPSGQRLYRRQDVEMILWIKHLLYVNRFTIQGAKKHLKALRTDPPPREAIEEIRQELMDIRKLLA